jgi:hypothetical protein
VSLEGLWQDRGRSNLSAISAHGENFVTHGMQANGLRFCAVKKVFFYGILDHRPEFLPGITSRDKAFRQAHGRVAAPATMNLLDPCARSSF